MRDPRQGRLARLIRKVYEADSLQCPKCKGPIRVIALIDDPSATAAFGLYGQPRNFIFFRENY